MATELREQGTQMRSYMDQPERDRTLQFVTGGTSIEAMAGIGIVVLAILGLTGILPIYMTSIAAIVAGAALLLSGGAIASRIRYLYNHSLNDEKFGELSSGIGAEVFGGTACIVLGILALTGTFPAVLLPIAAIVFGGVMLIGTGVTVRLSRFPAFNEGTQTETAAPGSDVPVPAAGTQALVGIAGIVLGVLALIHFAWMTLTLVALLSVGASMLLSGASVTSRLQGVLHHHVHHW